MSTCSCTVHVTIFSTGGKFHLVSNFMWLKLFLNSPVIMRSCTVHLEAYSDWSTALLLFIHVCCFCHTRTVQLTVSNTLVGRIIGRGGSKINSIQVHAHKHLYIWMYGLEFCCQVVGDWDANRSIWGCCMVGNFWRRKLSRILKFVAICKSFLCKILAHGIFWRHQRAIHKSFP